MLMRVNISDQATISEFGRSKSGNFQGNCLTLRDSNDIRMLIKNSTHTLYYRAGDVEEWVELIISLIRLLRSEEKLRFIDLDKYYRGFNQETSATIYQLKFRKKVLIRGVDEAEIKKTFVLNFNHISHINNYYFFNWEYANVILHGLIRTLYEGDISSHTKIRILRELK